jgi:osmotically-inducible protein OsmY
LEGETITISASKEGGFVSMGTDAFEKSKWRFYMVRGRMTGLVIIFLAASAMVFVGAQGAESTTDRNVNFWIKESLREDPRIDASEVNVTTDSGIVTLTGLVRTLAAKRYADLESKKIQGVRAVINEITVFPQLRSDTDIYQDILRRFLNSADLQPSDVWVKVVDGSVTLTGQVDSWSKRREAELLASEVRGVKAVINEVQLQYKKKRSDDEIKKDVVSSIGRDVYLCGLPIHVSVEECIVTLEGSVGNAYQKERASDDALFVVNVKNVLNNVEVRPWENEDVRKRIPVPSDEKIERAVREELIQDLRVADPFKISVEITAGDVTLRGIVPSYYQKRLASEDALDVVGVGWVANLLTVRSDWREDSAILDDEQFEMDVDPVLRGQAIRIRVKDGIVTLSGDVNTFYEKLHAAEVASRVLGVRNVVNTIEVNRVFTFSDNALRQAIKRRLASNAETLWVVDRIKVKVENGRAILEGSVDTWSEYREAARLAFLTEGIRGLDNRMAVAGLERHSEQWN